jgi:hypothetical protein
VYIATKISMVKALIFSECIQVVLF